MEECFAAPRKGSAYLSPEDVIGKLIHEFGYVMVSRAEGEKSLDRSEALFGNPENEDLRRPELGSPSKEKLLEDVRAKRGHSFVVMACDAAPGGRAPILTVLIRPGEVLGLGNGTKASLPLMKRFAKAIGYELKHE